MAYGVGKRVSLQTLKACQAVFTVFISVQKTFFAYFSGTKHIFSAAATEQQPRVLCVTLRRQSSAQESKIGRTN